MRVAHVHHASETYNHYGRTKDALKRPVISTRTRLEVCGTNAPFRNGRNPWKLSGDSVNLIDQDWARELVWQVGI
jgi:hypothetical protein